MTHTKAIFQKNEISIEADCLIWGIRVIIPIKFQYKLLQQLDDSHPDIGKRH